MQARRVHLKGPKSGCWAADNNTCCLVKFYDGAQKAAVLTAHLQVVGEEVHPLGGPGCQAGLERLGADLDEADCGFARQSGNLLRDSPGQVWGGTDKIGTI